MNEKELLAFAKNLIADYKRDIAQAVTLGVFTPQEAKEYTWADMLAENTGVELKSEAELEALADAELQKIRDAYI